MASIDEWLRNTLPKAAYEAEESDTQNGRLKHIAPKNTLAAPMSISVNASACDITFGRAFARTLSLDAAEQLFELMEAVTLGNLEESIWGFGPQQFCSRSTITLKTGPTTARKNLWLLYPAALRRTYTYEPYL